MQTEQPVSWQPMDAHERCRHLDLLRGIALFGVLMVNLLNFFRQSLFAHMLQFHSDLDWPSRAVDLLVAVLLEFKAFGLFSLAFGIGVAVQAERAWRNGRRPWLFLARRFLVLLGFGLMHLLLIANVDILCLYAVCGLLLLPLLPMPARLLLPVGLAALLLPGWGGPIPFPSEAQLPAHAERATQIYRDGNYAAILLFRWQETRVFILPLLIGSAQRTWGLMVVGMSLWRWGVVSNPSRFHRPLCWAAGSLGLWGLLTTAAEVSARAGGPAVPVPAPLQVLSPDVALTLAYAAALLTWTPPRHAVVTALEAAGRMAFTNYLTQSVVFSLLFYGYGFGLFGRVGTIPAALLGIALYCMQLGISVGWLKRYRFGPAEWLWRSLTYGRRQPLRRRRESFTVG